MQPMGFKPLGFMLWFDAFSSDKSENLLQLAGGSLSTLAEYLEDLCYYTL